MAETFTGQIEKITAKEQLKLKKTATKNDKNHS